jgi:hypothetical protein
MHMPFFEVKNELRLRNLSRGLIFAGAVIAACLCPTLAFGQTNSSWNGGIGNWSNATDWTPNQVPNNGAGNTYNVTIDSGGADMVTLNQNAMITSLTLGGVLPGGAVLTEATGEPETLTVTGGVIVNKTGLLDLESGSTLTVSGNLANSGIVGTNYYYDGGAGNTLTVNGTFTNNAGASFELGEAFSSDVANVGKLVNDGFLQIGTSDNPSACTLNLTNQPNGITDVLQGSTIILFGTLKAGANNGLANLVSIEGTLSLVNEQSLTLANLTVAGSLYIADSTLTLTNLTNSGTVNVASNTLNNFANELTVTETVTNQAGGQFLVSAVANINTLDNYGVVTVDVGLYSGATLNVAGTLTNQAGGKLSTNSGDVNVSGALINNGTMDIVGAPMSVSGGLTNYGTITMGEYHIVTTSELIIGASSVNLGTITLLGDDSHVPNSFITGAMASVVLTNEKIIEGGGNIGDGSMGLVNSSTGKILASSSTPLVIQVSSAGFQNNGAVQVNKGETLTITGAANSFLNFNGSNDSLTGGTYLVTGTLQFDNANIVTNAANITLSGTTSVIEDQHDNNALANFATNAGAGTFILESDRNFTTSGAFSNAGKVTIASGSTFTVGGTGSYTQTGGTTTVTGALAVTSPGAVKVLGGSVFGIGTITGNIDLTGGLLSPGAASKKAGELTVNGTYTQSSAGAFDVDLGGTKAGTQYDVLDITSTATLGGVLNVDLISGFKPTVGETFDIMDYTSETGTFAAVNLPKLAGGDTWGISYNATDVVLTVDGPGAITPASTHRPAAILSEATCFAARSLGSESCGNKPAATVTNGGEIHTASAGGGAVHNNIMAATHSTSVAGGGGVSHESSASAAGMARLYTCAYLPANVGHTIGCN